MLLLLLLQECNHANKSCSSRDAVIEIIKSINYHLISNCENAVIH